MSLPKSSAHVITVDGLQTLIAELQSAKYVVVGPTVRDHAIVYDEIQSIDDLPRGIGDEQGPGHYALRPRTDRAFFGFNVGPHAWKRFLFPSEVPLWHAQQKEGELCFREASPPSKNYAFLGVRACDLAAIRIHDRVFLDGKTHDPVYKSTRERAFIIAVNCGQAASTCFCTSMKTGPKVQNDYDLSLTEIISSSEHQFSEHQFVVEVGSPRGRDILSKVAHRTATEPEIAIANKIVETTAQTITRTLDTHNIKTFLAERYEHPRWDRVAERCLSCGNCTMACPTCFCTSVEDRADLLSHEVTRYRVWDSCFNGAFTYLHGGAVRSSVTSRYRQWITHKLSTWYDQFDSSGCVGCGRCIAWCPVGIDITEEIAVLRREEANRS